MTQHNIYTQVHRVCVPPMPKPHIVFITPVLFQVSCGLSTYYFNLFSWLSRWQYRMSLIVAGDPKRHELSLPFLNSLGVSSPVTFIPFVECPDGSTLPVDAVLAVSTIRELNPDVLWCTESSLFIVKDIAHLCEEMRVPLVCRLHQSLETFFRRCAECYESFMHPVLKRLLPLLLSSCTMVLTSDWNLAKNFEGENWRPRHEELRIQITPIDEMIFKPRFLPPRAEALKMEQSLEYLKTHTEDQTQMEIETVCEHLYRRYWLFVGQLIEAEGVMRVPEIWKHVPAETPLVIVGEGPLQSWLEERASRNWYFYKTASRRLLAKLYQNAAGLITAHTQPSFGYMSLESALCACPILNAVNKSTIDQDDTDIIMHVKDEPPVGRPLEEEEDLRPLTFTEKAACRVWNNELECAQYIIDVEQWQHVKHYDWKWWHFKIVIFI
jgi:glycosyltransferase involved in cell wall biosynthesis